MKRSQRRSWWGLYALGPLTVVLLYVANRIHVRGMLHNILYLSVILVVASLAWLWSERHADLVGSEGVNARAEATVLATAGIEAGRLAPSQTARQAHYRRVMLCGEIDPMPEAAGAQRHSM